MPKRAILSSVMATYISVGAMGVGLPAVGFTADEKLDEGLSEITVTARKRDESILKAPVIETAITAQTLNQYNVQDLKALSAEVPNLIISGTNSTLGAQASLRGVGTF